MVEKKVSLLQWMATYDQRWVYLILFLVVLGPMVSPIGMPISVSASTRNWYEKVTALKKGDIVLDSWSTEYSGYMELKPGLLATHRMLINKGVKLFVCLGHPEGFAVANVVFEEELKSYMDKHNYKYGVDYIILGYVFPNVASTIAAVTNFQDAVKTDWKGVSIKGTFLDRIKTGADITMIVDFTTGAGNPGLIDHIVLRFGTPMIQNPIGVSLPGALANLDAKLLQAVLASARGGAELEYLIREPGPGLIMMDAFSLGHYMVIIFIIIGNIGYFGWTKRERARERTTIR